MDFIISALGGLAVGVVGAAWRLKGERTLMQALLAVVQNGPGPWRPPK